MISNQICNQLLTHRWLQGFCFHTEYLKASTYQWHSPPGGLIWNRTACLPPPDIPITFLSVPNVFLNLPLSRLLSASTGELKSLLPAVPQMPRFFTKKNLPSVLTVETKRPQPPLGLGYIPGKEGKKREIPSQILRTPWDYSYEKKRKRRRRKLVNLA